MGFSDPTNQVNENFPPPLRNPKVQAIMSFDWRISTDLTDEEEISHRGSIYRSGEESLSEERKGEKETGHCWQVRRS